MNRPYSKIPFYGVPLVTGFVSFTLQADSVWWLGSQNQSPAVSASFFDPNNWSSATLPNGTDEAALGVPLFQGGSTSFPPTYLHFGDFRRLDDSTVFGGQAETWRLTIGDGSWTFDFAAGSAGATGGPTVGLPGSYHVADQIQIGIPVHNVSYSANLTIKNGALSTDGWIAVGRGFQSQGTLKVDGSSAEVWSKNSIVLGEGGASGRLEVLNGAKVVSDVVTSGPYTGPNGELNRTEILVSGQGSYLQGFSSIADNGSAVFENGAKVVSTDLDGNAHYSFIGIRDGSDAKVTVTGAGSEWTGTDRLTIGGVYHTDTTGKGHLEILDGAKVESIGASIGNRSKSQGSVLVSGEGSLWKSTDWLAVGDDGTGSLTISDRAVVQSSQVDVGYTENGRGTLSVEDGGRLEAERIRIGTFQGAIGEAVVKGEDSLIKADQWIIVGDDGKGSLTIEDEGKVIADELNVGATKNGDGKLTIEDGGTLEVRGFSVGRDIDSKGEALVTGGASKLAASEYIVVGERGSGSLEISHGAEADTRSLLVGQSGGTGKLSILSGGSVISDFGLVGHSGQSSGEALVSGGGSQWNVGDFLAVGSQSFGSLVVKDGGKVSDSWAAIGDQAGSEGEARVTGPGSEWNNSDALFVGHGGKGTLTIENGGKVTDTWSAIGDLAGSVGEARVTGPGSQWNSSDALFVGHGGKGTLTIENGGKVTDTWAAIGDLAGSVGEARVSGNGSEWITSDWLAVGHAGKGSLAIEDGGKVSTGWAYVGDLAGSEGDVRVTGTGSTWVNSSSLIIGGAGTGSLTVQNGGVVETGDQVNDNLIIGGSENGRGTLTIQNGGRVESNHSHIGSQTGSEGEASVKGVGSVWNNTGFLSVGNGGKGDLTIEDGGKVTTGWTAVGHLPGSEGSIDIRSGGNLMADNSVLGANPGATGRGQVSGNGSKWSTAQALVVGGPGNGELTIADGATLSSKDAYIGGDSGAQGSVLVTGTGASWDNSGFLSVGTHGQGTLFISEGGRVDSDTTAVGLYEGSAAHVRVSGTGSTFNTETLRLAGKGSVARLDVLDGGVFTTDGTGITSPNNAGKTEITVSGPGSQLTSAFTLDVFGSGSSLQVKDNGSVKAHTLSVGGDSANPAQLRVEGGGSLVLDDSGLPSLPDNTASLQLGTSGYAGAAVVTGSGSRITAVGQIAVGNRDGGQGSLTIADGALVESRSGRVGGWGHLEGDAQSSGTALVTGELSRWTISQQLSVGWGGDGLLDITDGARVDAGTVIMSLFAPDSGTINLSDNGALTANSVRVGFTATRGQGGGATINVDTGGYLLANTFVELGQQGILNVGHSGKVLIGSGSLDAVAAGSVFVGTGGLLSGTGTVHGKVVVDGGTLAPGHSPGTLHLDELELTSLATLTFEINGSLPGQYDLIDVEGDLHLGGRLELVFGGGFSPTAGDFFEIFRYGGDLTGHFDEIDFGGLDPALYAFRDSGSSFGLVRLDSYSAVPEVNQLWPALGGIGALAWFARRKTLRRQTA